MNEIDKLWNNFLENTNREPTTPLYEAFHFDDNKYDANLLAELVVSGQKRATASLALEYETGNKKQPVSGDFSIVTNWDGTPICVIETQNIEICAFRNVSKEFAALEGEGDGSLAFWRDVHLKYFGRVCLKMGWEMSEDILVVCESFDVVYVPKQIHMS